MYGKKYMGIDRTTFVIGPEGKISAIVTGLKPDEHAGCGDWRVEIDSKIQAAKYAQIAKKSASRSSIAATFEQCWL